MAKPRSSRESPTNHQYEKQNHMIIWLDVTVGDPAEYIHLKKAFASNTDPRAQTWTTLKDNDYLHIIAENSAVSVQFEGVKFLFQAFNNEDDCLKAFEENQDKRIFFITSGSMGKIIVPRIIERYPHIFTDLITDQPYPSIYVFCHNIVYHMEWGMNYIEYIQMFNFDSELLERLTRDIAEYFIERSRRMRRDGNLKDARRRLHWAKKLWHQYDKMLQQIGTDDLRPVRETREIQQINATIAEIEVELRARQANNSDSSSDDERANTSIYSDVYSLSEKYNGIIEFQLNTADQIINDVQLQMNLNIRAETENRNQSQNIIILCVGVEFPDKNMCSPYEIQSYDNPFKFITTTLSIKDKTIYLIISTDKSDSIIPIVHKHYCIEKIYAYGSINSGSAATLLTMSEKISGPHLNIEKLCGQISYDILTTVERSLRWNRSFELFTMLHTQRLANHYSFSEVSTDIPRDEYIIIFHCNNRKNFHIYRKSISVCEFNNANKCIQHIKEATQSQVFLIISGSMTPPEIELIFDYQQIHAIYFFANSEFIYPINKKKVSGVFGELKDLSKQLHQDVLFDRQQHLHMSRIYLSSMSEHSQKLIYNLSGEQITFLTHNLFLDILSQTPILNFKPEDLLRICSNLFSEKEEQMVRYVNQLYKGTDEVKNIEQDPRFSQILLRFYQLNQLKELFILQKPLKDIQRRVFESDPISTTNTVYCTRIISNDILKSIVDNISGYITIGTFILATKSLLTARTIARNMADNGLIALLFQIKVNEGTRLLEVEIDRVIFRLDSVFRLESINLGPDGVYYVKIELANSEYQTIKEQLQFETGVPLSWLTYGNYLHFFEQPQQAKTFFEFILERLPIEHTDRPSIYNNMALIYAMENGKDERSKAEEICKTALKLAESMDSDLTVNQDKDRPCSAIPTTTMSSPRTSINHSTVIGSIADVYCDKGDYELALKYYKEALELSTDLHYRSYYQQMIVTVKKNI